jgi:Rhodopirellula transposase DDE domain
VRLSFNGVVGEAQAIRKKYKTVAPFLTERGRRIWAAAEARALGWGGTSLVATATGLARNTIQVGLREAAEPAMARRRLGEEDVRSRRAGGGRKPLTESDPELAGKLESLVEPTTRGDPMSPLRWTCLSLTELSGALTKMGHPAGRDTVAHLLRQRGYSLQSNRKTKEGTSHPDRDKQFRYISRQTQLFQARGQPVISVDTKKKELVGEFKNGGREWRPKGEPEPVNVHDFRDDEVSSLGGKAIPYGVYDSTANAGWVSVGIDHDTSAFAMASIRAWWRHMGQRAYPKAREVLITADAGGSNDHRRRTWKVELQKLADETGLKITVCHFPPGTSKWNKIEHRMFCHITQNWRGRPLVNHEAIVNLIGNTSTKTGLTIRAKLDRRKYPLGIKVTNDELARVRISPAEFHGEWNYAISPE